MVTTYLNSRHDLMEVMRDRYFRPRLQATRAVIARAVARGEIRADAGPSWPSTCCSVRWPTGGCSVLRPTRTPSAA